MWSTELAMKTKTADSRIGSHSALRLVITSSGGWEWCRRMRERERIPGEVSTRKLSGLEQQLARSLPIVVSTPPDFSFRGSHEQGAARRGELVTPHGAVETPAFMPVATQGTIKGLSMDEVAGAGGRMVLSNAYHLYLRPGDLMVRALGGLHAFTRWDGPMLTDSGGFQVFSLAKLRTVAESGAAMERSLRWLERCRVEFDRLEREGREPVPAELTAPGGAPPLASED